jgi:hypothetical protein
MQSQGPKRHIYNHRHASIDFVRKILVHARIFQSGFSHNPLSAVAITSQLSEYATSERRCLIPWPSGTSPSILPGEQRLCRYRRSRTIQHATLPGRWLVALRWRPLIYPLMIQTRSLLQAM